MALATFINFADDNPVAVNPDHVVAVRPGRGEPTVIYTTAGQASEAHQLVVTDELASVIDRLNEAKAL
ncbi:hypothetical protein CN934_05245 [Ensifer sp. MMN_5]|nr:hypothetical protein CN934_05245 [Ensifer sp. MMN_5]